METLTDLIRVVNRKRISKIYVLDKTFLNAKSENLYYQLYHAIETQKVTTDDEAARLLYGTGRQDPRYKMLKSRLKEKVLNTVLLIDVDENINNDYGRAYYRSIIHSHKIESLVYLTGTTKLVYELIMVDYHNALRYKFYDILIGYSYYLLVYYTLNGNTKSFNSEETVYLKYIEYGRNDKIARYLYNKVLVHFESGKPITAILLLKSKKILDELYKYKLELDNFNIDFQYYYLAMQYYDYNNENKSILLVCKEAETLMINVPFSITNNRKMVTLIFSLKAHVKLKKYAIAKLLLANYEKKYYPQDKLYNWFILKETEFKLFFQSSDLKKSYEVYNDVMANKSLNRMVENMKEKWKIYHAYLVFLDNYINKGDYKKFSVPKFLNSVPLNSKDKSGFNFAIRIIEILFMAARKQYNKVFAQMESLRIYRSRYLNDITYKRNHLFLSLLLKSEKSGFDAKVMQNATWTEIQELRNRNHYIAEWEIIPYEELWDIFVDLSKK